MPLDPKTEELIKTILATEGEGEKQLEPVFKSANLSDRSALAVRLAMRALAAYRDEIPESAHAAIAKSIGLKMPEVKREEPKPDPVATLTPEAKELFAKAEARAAKSAADLEEMRKSLNAERTERRTKEYVAKAEALRAVPGKVTDVGALLMRIADRDAKDGDEIETVLKSMSGVIEASEAFKVRGRGGDEKPSALEVIRKSAEDFQKADPSLSAQQATARAVKANPKLKAAYYAEKEERN